MKIAIIFGTRPEVIKFAPLITLLKDRFDVKIVSSGQHLELTNQMIDFFKIKTDYSFGCMTDEPDLEALFECIEENLIRVFDIESPDLLIVQGDTLTTYAAAFVAFMLKKPVFHLEAGLRTYKKFSPFPEEMLRTLVGKIADFHFAPTQRAYENLKTEGIREDRILITGNTVVDAILLAQEILDEKAVIQELTEQAGDLTKYMDGKKLVLVTSHRRENIGLPLKNICDTINELNRTYKDCIFLWPLHKNPLVRDIVSDTIKEHSQNIIFTESLSYQCMIYLMKNSYIIMTDSGGIQEEAPSFGKPVIILRDTTERPEIVETGVGFLTGTDKERILEIFQLLYENDKYYRAISCKKNPFGDGKASSRILKFLMLDNIRSFIERYPFSSEEILNSEHELILDKEVESE